jgi:hypothetical protein
MPASDIVRTIKGSLLLNLPRLQRDGCDMEAEVPGHLHRIEFSGIEPLRDSIERTGQGVGRRTVARTSKTSASTRILHPHKMPSGLANHGIEDRSCEILNEHPVRADGLLERVQPVWQNTALAQKDRVHPHD